MIIRRILAAIALLCAFAAPAYAQKTKAALIAEIPQLCPAGQTSGQCTATNAQTIWKDTVNSIMPTAPVVSGNLACFNGTTGLLQDCGSSPTTTPLIVGTTSIISGTTTRVLFDNAGVLGEYVISGSGNVAMTTSPVFTTPNLGTPSAANLANATGLPYGGLPSGTLDTVLGYFGSTTANAIAVNNCSNALTYSTSTHTFGCNVSGGTGTVTTPGAGLVSSTTSACSQAANQSTLSKAECVNAQSGTSYAIQDGDRAKLITTSNISPQTLTIAQAGASTTFQAGWYADIQNVGAGTAIISPTTSTVNGLAGVPVGPGMSGRLISDGSNYRFLLPGAEMLLETLSPSSVSSISTSASWAACKSIRFQVRNITPATAGANFLFQVNSSGVKSTSYLNSGFSSSNGGALSFQTTTIGIAINGGNSVGNSDPGMGGPVFLSNVNSTSAKKVASGTMTYVSNGSQTATTATIGGWWDGGDGAVSGGQFLFSNNSSFSGAIDEYCVF